MQRIQFRVVLPLVLAAGRVEGCERHRCDAGDPRTSLEGLARTSPTGARSLAEVESRCPCKPPPPRPLGAEGLPSDGSRRSFGALRAGGHPRGLGGVTRP